MQNQHWEWHFPPHRELWRSLWSIWITVSCDKCWFCPLANEWAKPWYELVSVLAQFHPLASAWEGQESWESKDFHHTCNSGNNVSVTGIFWFSINPWCENHPTLRATVAEGGAYTTKDFHDFDYAVFMRKHAWPHARTTTCSIVSECADEQKPPGLSFALENAGHESQPTIHTVLQFSKFMLTVGAVRFLILLSNHHETHCETRTWWVHPNGMLHSNLMAASLLFLCKVVIAKSLTFPPLLFSAHVVVLGMAREEAESIDKILLWPRPWLCSTAAWSSLDRSRVRPSLLRWIRHSWCWRSAAREDYGYRHIDDCMKYGWTWLGDFSPGAPWGFSVSDVSLEAHRLKGCHRVPAEWHEKESKWGQNLLARTQMKYRFER